MDSRPRLFEREPNEHDQEECSAHGRSRATGCRRRAAYSRGHDRLLAGQIFDARPRATAGRRHRTCFARIGDRCLEECPMTTRPRRAIPHSAPSAATSGTAVEIAKEKNPLKKAGQILAPGFTPGASDDDPSGIGTYAVAGASLGLQTLWTALLTFPLMAAVQNVCARLGMVSGQGLAGVLRDHYPKPILYGAVLLLFGANTINVGADLGAIADAVHAVSGIKAVWLIRPVALGILALQIFGSYRLIANTLNWLPLALGAYVVDVFIVHPDVLETLRATVVPTFSLDPLYITTLVAILGTTISPYLFFWQSSVEVEEQIDMGRTTKNTRQGGSPAGLGDSALAVNIGMGFSNLIMYFIILATALTLFKAGKTDITSAADAAEALKPLLGDFAGIIFAAGGV